MVFFIKTDGYQKMCDINKNVIKMGMIIKWVYYIWEKVVIFFKSKLWYVLWILFTLGSFVHHFCRDPSLGFATKVKAYEGAGQEWSPRVTFHAPGSAHWIEEFIILLKSSWNLDV
jgi:hypothetical protein